MLHDGGKLPLRRNLFAQDALVFKHLQSASVTLESDKTDHGLTLYFEGFPYLGIWTKDDANFLCIEPWCGIADSVGHDQNFKTKEGIERISPKASWSRRWKVRFF